MASYTYQEMVQELKCPMVQELKCPICKDFFEVPKLIHVICRCHHVACLECLQDWVAVALDKGSFPCPLCREKCSVPPEGLSALKTDFRLATLVEKYQQMMSDKCVVYCNACSKRAFHLCETCDNIYLCRECFQKHGQDPLTAAHKLVGICFMHDKILAMYCRKCATAICSVCLINDHTSDSQEHDVVPHQEVADEQAGAVAAAEKKLDGIWKQKENALGIVIDIQDSVLATIDSAIARLAQQFDTSVKCADNNHSRLTEESSNIQKQIQVLTKRKNAADEEIVLTEQKITPLGRQKEHYTKYLNQYRDGFRDKFHEAVTQAVAENEDIKRQLGKGRKEMSTWSMQRILDDQTVPSYIKVKAELTNALTEVDQVDRAETFIAASENIIRLVPVSGQIGVQLIFSTMKKFAAEFCAAESDRYEFIQRARHFGDGHLAVLHTHFKCRRSDIWSDIISVHRSILDEYRVRRIDTNVHPAVDMTVTPKGELVVLRKAEPPVRVFNTRNSDFRDININLSKKEVSKVLSIETDEDGNIFVADTTGRVRVFNPEGAIINEIKLRKAYLGRLNYCKYTRYLHIADGHDILRYHWDGTTLKGMPSFAHGLDGFICMDIGIGTFGEVFVAGIMKPTGRVLVFQIVEPESSKSEMIKLTFDDHDRYLHNGRDDWFPDISVFGNTLALGLNGQFELFHLKP